MHPSATNVNPQAASCPRSAKAASVSVVLLSLDSGQGMHPNSLDKVRVRAVGPSWSQRATSNVPGNRGGLKKKQRQRQTVQTEENSQKDMTIQRRLAKDLQITKLGDDQERRPFSQVAQNGRVIVQHEDTSG